MPDRVVSLADPARVFPLADPALPTGLARLLAAGGEGGPILDEAARLAAGAGLAALAADLALAAFEADPLRPGAARTAREALAAKARPAMAAGPPGPLSRLLAAVAGAERPPADERYLARLYERRDATALLAYLSDRLTRDPADLRMAGQLWTHAVLAGDFEAAARVPAALTDPDLGPLRLRFEGDLAFFSRNDEAAARAYAAALGPDAAGPYAAGADRRGPDAAGPYAAGADRRGPDAHGPDAAGLGGTGLPATRIRLAEALWRAGARDEALHAWRAALAARPWHVNTLLRLSDAATGLSEARRPLPGRLVVFLYTFNKADDLAATLAALARTDADFVPRGLTVAVADNGSTDGTGAVLDGLAGSFPFPLSRLAFPVNVGAPAARNWLMRLPETDGAALAAYLDDDAIVPPDWAGRFGAAVAAYPEAGVWGCRVRDAARPLVIQSADLHLRPLSPDPDSRFGRRFEPSRSHLLVPDMGQFDYVRPCASVTGCCHLFRLDGLGEVGDFDIRFSPSQYDDLDHDLRLLLMGRRPVYQGHLAVAHAKSTGRRGAVGGPEWGQAFANQFKLHHKYGHAELTEALGTTFRAVLDDAAAKWARHGPGADGLGGSSGAAARRAGRGIGADIATGAADVDGAAGATGAAGEGGA